MIGGVITVVGLIVTRMPAAMQPSLPLPDQITLPEGVSAQAFTQAPAWYAIVTSDDRILIFERKTGALRQEIRITPGPVGQ